MNPHPLPVTVLSGLAGAGTAALLDALLDDADGLRIGSIAFGPIDERRDLPNGSARVVLATHSIEALESAIIELSREQRFEALVIQSDATINPMDIAEQLAFGDDDDATLAGRAHLDTFVTVIDASTFLRDYARADAIDEASGDDKTVVEALVEQIEFCDVLVIGKSDLVGADDVERIARMLHALNPRARQVRAESGRVPVTELVNTGRFDFDATASAPGWLAILNGEEPANDDGVAHFVYRARRPFHPERLWTLLHEEWPDVIRAKGFFWLATRGEVGGSLSQAGGTLRHGPAGVWWAAQDRSEWPTDDPELEAEIVAEWFGDPDDNSVGDRRQELVLIGPDLDVAKWQQKFDACLLDDDEWAQGPEQWQRFADPFPAWDIDEHDHEHDHDHDYDHDHGPDCDCEDHRH
jgi:G3E family GTPase